METDKPKTETGNYYSRLGPCPFCGSFNLHVDRSCVLYCEDCDHDIKEYS